MSTIRHRLLRVSLGLLLVAAVGAGIVYATRPPRIGGEYRALIDAFRERRYPSLNEIVPKPYRILDAKDVLWPKPGARHYLYYRMRDDSDESQMLVISLDEQLGLVGYFVKRED